MYNNFDSSCEVIGFEGPEKRLEINFKLNSSRHSSGLRCLSRDEITQLLDLAHCTIVSSKSNEYFDSYVLSESSLFVYPSKLMIKTCGTTTLLNCIPKLLEFATALDLSVELVMYSRKNFLFPHKQMYPHLNWSDEVDFLNNIFDGTDYVLGPLTQSHWYLYLADYSDHRSSMDTKDLTLEIMMHDLERSAASRFYRLEGIQDDTKFPGISDLLPGSQTDEFNFTPCGYSMNGLFQDAYYTIHVTPEPHCSYASFETNASLSSYTHLISSVCEIFKPGSFTFILSNKNGVDKDLCRQEYVDLSIHGYGMKYKTFCELEHCMDVTLCNFDNSAGGRNKRFPRLPHR